MKLSVPLVLASRSPRRRRLLRQLGLSFSVIPADIDESVEPSKPVGPADFARQLAVRKALVISRRKPGALVLGADTIVVHEERIFGKPANAIEARSMLRRLSGSTHAVYTAIALTHAASQRAADAVARTDVTFGRLSDHEIRNYVATGSPLDKAGAYGIQDDLGAIFIDRIDGDYYTVVGLPMRHLYQLLKSKFSDLFTL